MKRAEGVGFEPTGPCGPPVFKTGAIDHSTTPPRNWVGEMIGVNGMFFKAKRMIGHLFVLLAAYCGTMKSEAGRRAWCWRLLRGAHECRRGGMVDATDLKSVEGQPSWGFESPRRHMHCRLLSPQHTHPVWRCRPMGIVGDCNQFLRAALADQQSVERIGMNAW